MYDEHPSDLIDRWIAQNRHREDPRTQLRAAEAATAPVSKPPRRLRRWAARLDW